MSNNTKQSQNGPGYHPRPDPAYPGPINQKNVKNIFTQCEDFQTREVFPALDGPQPVTLCWVDGLVNGGSISEDVLRPLTEDWRFAALKEGQELANLIMSGAVYSSTAKRRETLDDLVADLMNGFCAILFDAAQLAVTFEVKTSNIRAISEPSTEKSVKGSKDSFVETLRVNTSLVRRKLKTPRLKSRSTIIGRKSETPAVVMYVEQIASDQLVQDIMDRLDAIDIDGLIAAGDLEEYVVDDPNTPFPQMLHTERPDKFATALLDGQVGILIDGLPNGFILPATFANFLRVPEDESQHYAVATSLRILRWGALLLSLTLPALLVAISMYHQEMIPTNLLISMIDAKQRVPFNVTVEVLSMLAAFELLQEAGLRLPDTVGQTVSIIGALIVGQSAVEARVVSPIAVIIVALAGITGYTIPSQDLSYALRLCRFLLVLAASGAGLFGVAAGLVLLVWHLSSIESFGVAYTSPLTDTGKHGVLRTLVRAPIRQDKFRDEFPGVQDRRRQK